MDPASRPDRVAHGHPLHLHVPLPGSYALGYSEVQTADRLRVLCGHLLERTVAEDHVASPFDVLS